MRMETDDERKDKISIEIEKICGEWSIHKKQIVRPKPQSKCNSK
jgi:hypothetical protein